ncbi:MAG TPA: hypothetical protein VLE22_24505 [Bryobacteraceae bacterium]|nr:hypothetical protein [Bryobacteraceae bacterium]
MAIPDDETGRPAAPVLQLSQPCRPTLDGLPIAALDGQDDLAPVTQAGEDDEHDGLVLLEPGFDVDPVHPEVHGLQVSRPSRLDTPRSVW